MHVIYSMCCTQDVMIFSSSKHGGLAGTRFGWGLIKNDELIQHLSEIIYGTIFSVSEDSMLRVYNTIGQILSKLI